VLALVRGSGTLTAGSEPGLIPERLESAEEEGGAGVKREWGP
jgi:hypothetical protein